MSDLTEFDVRATDLTTSVVAVHEPCGAELTGDTLAELVNAAVDHTCQNS